MMQNTTDFYYHYTHFYTPTPFEETSLLVSDCMAYTSSKNFCIDRQTYYNHLVFYVYKGTFHIKQYGKKLTLHLLWFHFRGPGMCRLLKLLKDRNQLPYLVHNRSYESLFTEAFRLTQTGADTLTLSGHLYQTLMTLLKNSHLHEQNTSNIPKELSDSTRYMSTNLAANLTLDDLSRFVGMSKYHFSHLFKKWYGIPPMQYYTNLKMDIARRLLAEDILSIQSVAEQLGYLDIGHFRKMFKSYFGVSPSEFRKTTLEKKL